MPRHRRPVDVGVHRLFPADRVAREQKEPAEAGDLVERLLAVVAADLDPVFLHQKRHEVPAIALAVALDAADLVEKRTQDPGKRVAHAGEGIDRAPAHGLFDPGLAGLLRPFVQALGRVVDVAIVEPAVVGIEHDLADGRTGAFRHHPVDHAFAFRHPGSRETHDVHSFCSHAGQKRHMAVTMALKQTSSGFSRTCALV